MKRKILAVLAGVVVLAVATGFAPANSDPRAKLAKIGSAFKAHGVTFCDGPLAAKVKTDLPVAAWKHGELAVHDGRLVDVTRPCLPLDPVTGLAPPEEVVHAEGQIDVVVYKNAAKARRYAKKDWFNGGQLGYVWRSDVLVVLEGFPSPEVEQAFRATMNDLNARPVFEGSLR